MEETLTNVVEVNYTLQGREFSNEAESTFTKFPQILKLTKEQTPTVGLAGDVVEFTITMDAQTTIEDVILSDDLATAGYTFISGTVTIDGVSAPTEDPTAGINLGTFNGMKVVKFNATVN